jgi:regulator of sigma D
MKHRILTKKYRRDLTERYINNYVDSMSLYDLQVQLYMMIEDDLEGVSDQQLIDQIYQLNPELLANTKPLELSR